MAETTAAKPVTSADANHAAPLAPTVGQKAFLVLVVVVPLLGLVYGVLQFWDRGVGWTEIGLLLSFYALTTVGIGAGFHRMLTHRGFLSPAPVRFVLLALGSMALEGPP